MTALGLHGNGSAPYPNLGGTVGDSRGGAGGPLRPAEQHKTGLNIRDPSCPLLRPGKGSKTLCIQRKQGEVNEGHKRTQETHENQ